jgi:hypothetical protein
MSKRNICVTVVIGAILMGGAPVARADTQNSLLASFGRFQIDDGDTKTLRRGGAVKAYRVCLDDGAAAVPLKVSFEGREAIVVPGECRLIEANKIKLASAGKLQEGMTLIGRFNNTSRKQYRTSVSVAQTARNAEVQAARTD